MYSIRTAEVKNQNCYAAFSSLEQRFKKKKTLCFRTHTKYFPTICIPKRTFLSIYNKKKSHRIQFGEGLLQTNQL